MSIESEFLQRYSSSHQLWPDTGELYIKQDLATGITILISIHNTNLGPALGGCRFIEYGSIAQAIYDVTRLAKGMTYKGAAAGLKMGGGKSVIIKPKNLTDRQALFQAFGRFVNDLNGRYITAMDSGSTIEDMAAIALETPYVSSKPSDGDPSPYTATGVFQGILAAVKHKLQRDTVEGLTVAIQGIGGVGYHLAQHLHQHGAKLIVTDIDTQRVERAVAEFGARPVALEAIFSQDCDILSPCALGAIINDQTLPQIKAKIIAGAANNQLAELRHGDTLHQKGILYAPDYVINAGGVIHCVYRYHQMSQVEEAEKINQIFDNMTLLFNASAQQNTPTYLEADRLAESRFL